jgi:acyl carrier protein
MLVVLELENEFAVRIPTARLPELLDVDSIARVLAASRAQ